MSGMGTYDLETGRELLQVPDRDGAVVGEVDLRLDGEEAVDLALGGELGGVVLDVHGDRRGFTRVLLLALHNRVSFKIIEA